MAQLAIKPAFAATEAESMSPAVPASHVQSNARLATFAILVQLAVVPAVSALQSAAACGTSLPPHAAPMPRTHCAATEYNRRHAAVRATVCQRRAEPAMQWQQSKTPRGGRM